MAEKTEKASPKKLRDARKKGQVAKSQDFPSAFTFATAIFGTLAAASYLYKNLASYKDMVEFKGRVHAREHGKALTEGKDYIIKDGDVVLFFHA